MFKNEFNTVMDVLSQFKEKIVVITNTRNYVYEEITAILKASNNGYFLKNFLIKLIFLWFGIMDQLLNYGLN